MPQNFHLALLIHAHQPCGNFEHVLERAYETCYLPFIEQLEKHPGVHLGLHYSGPLLVWIEKHRPEYFARLRNLVQAGRVELVGGGFFEPILISIPPEDQCEQITRLAVYLEKHFGRLPSGAWLAERVWEPQLPTALANANVAYTLVDDIHFLSAGFEPEELFGAYIAEDRGRTVWLYPGQKALRYLIPFGKVGDVIAYLRDAASVHPGGVAAMGDDMEKFGVWPGTHEHCYKDGWLSDFFTALEANSDWLEVSTPVDYLETHQALGRADLPTASYTEMMEWALPTRVRQRYHEVPKARDLLLRAQCNDAYWHGIFGGIYAPHLRTDPWRNLIRAEAIADRQTPGALFPRVELLDYDADGANELLFTSPEAQALLKPSDGGTIAAFDFRPAAATLVNSILRRPEAYHTRLREAAGKPATSAVASIHEQTCVKEPGLERFLRYDRWPRHAFRVLLFDPSRTHADYEALELREDAGFAGGSYTVKDADAHDVELFRADTLTLFGTGDAPGPKLLLTKEFSFGPVANGCEVVCEVVVKLEEPLEKPVAVGIESIINLLAPAEPDRFFETSAGHENLRFSGALPAPVLRMEDGWQRVRIALHAPLVEEFWVAPIETVSESEEGFERVYQGSQILALWRPPLTTQKTWSTRLVWRIEAF